MTGLGECDLCGETVLPGDECRECYQEAETVRHDACCPEWQR